MSAPWPPPPDLESIQQLVREADIEGLIVYCGAPADEYDDEAETLLAAISRFPSSQLTTDVLQPIIETIWQKSFNLDDAALVRASLPSNEEAARYYAEGRAKQEKYDVAGARDLFLKAVAADPDFPLAHAYLADAWTVLGFQAKGVAEAKRSLELSWKLPPEGSRRAKRAACVNMPHACGYPPAG